MKNKVDRPSASDIRAMAEQSVDPVIRQALRTLASDMEAEAAAAPQQMMVRPILA